MSKDEIEAGIKNALKRGEDLEKAKQSFINSGYNPDDVESAAEGLRGIIERKYDPELRDNEQPEKSKKREIKPKKLSPASQEIASGTKVAVIFLLILLFLITIGVVFALIFREEIINFIEGLF